jgi:hypothetical protein
MNKGFDEHIRRIQDSFAGQIRAYKEVIEDQKFKILAREEEISEVK